MLIFKKKYLTSQKIQWDTLIGNFTYCFYKTTGVELSINIFPELKVQLGVADSIASFQIDMLFESIWCSINSLKMFLLKNMRYRQIESAISSINQDSFKKSDEILPQGIIVTTKSPFSRLRKKHLIIESSGLKNPKRAPDFIVTIGIEDLPYFNNDIKLINTGSQIDIYALLLIKPNALYLIEITLYDEVYIKLDEDQELVLKNGMHLIFSEDVKEVRCMVGIKQNGIQFFNFINDWDDIEVNFDEGESERLITIHEESNNAIIIKSQNKFKLKTISNYSIFYSLKSLDEEAGRARLAELRFNTTFRVRETEFKYEPL